MLSGIYASASALEALEQQQEIITNNLANLNTTGFKRSKGMFRSFEEILQAEGGLSTAPELTSTTPVLASEIDFSRGQIKRTGGTLDLAIDGDGFFVVQSPNGLRYTRKGSFSLSEDGTIVNSAGWPVVSDTGQLLVPSGTKNIQVAEDGKVDADNAFLGRFMVVDIQDTSRLIRDEHSTFRTSDPDAAPPLAERISLRQGYLESSNVEVIDELVAMIATMRAYEATQRMISQQSQTLEKLTSQAVRGAG